MGGGVGGVTPPWKKFLSANSAPCRQTLRPFEKSCNLSANIAVCQSSSDFAKWVPSILSALSY